MILIASIVPYEAFPTKDGSVLLGGGNDNLYGILCRRLGRPEWASDGRFVTNADRVKQREVLVPMIAELTREKTTKVRLCSTSLCHVWLILKETNFENSGVIGMVRHPRGKWDAICRGK